MKLQQNQMTAFAQAADTDFQERLLVHVRTYFAEQYALLGERQTRDLIAYGVERAQGYGFTREDHICRYVSIMFTIGDQFDTDRALGWPRNILSDPNIREPGERIARLHEAACDFLSESPGEAESRP